MPRCDGGRRGWRRSCSPSHPIPSHRFSPGLQYLPTLPVELRKRTQELGMLVERIVRDRGPYIAGAGVVPAFSSTAVLGMEEIGQACFASLMRTLPIIDSRDGRPCGPVNHHERDRLAMQPLPLSLTPALVTTRMLDPKVSVHLLSWSKCVHGWLSCWVGWLWGTRPAAADPSSQLMWKRKKGGCASPFSPLPRPRVSSSKTRLRVRPGKHFLSGR